MDENLEKLLFFKKKSSTGFSLNRLLVLEKE
jgi:hypothetical protein